MSARIRREPDIDDLEFNIALARKLREHTLGRRAGDGVVWMSYLERLSEGKGHRSDKDPRKDEKAPK